MSSHELNVVCKPFVPQQQTQRNTSWAVNVFKAWVEKRSQCSSGVVEHFPIDLLEVQYAVDVVDRTLAAFVIEVRKADGTYYPGASLKNILAALHCKMKECQGAIHVTTFLNAKLREKYYPQLNNALDRQLRFLCQNGIGIERKRAEIITLSTEEKLWEEGIIGISSPQMLLNAIFFWLRGVQEHHKLSFSQLVRASNPSRYTYLEFGSKNRSGGIHDNTNSKVVTIVSTNSPKCLVKLLDLYFSKVPPDVQSKSGSFYLMPLLFTPTGTRPWFLDSPLPLRKLQGLLKQMCKDIKVVGNLQIIV